MHGHRWEPSAVHRLSTDPSDKRPTMSMWALQLWWVLWKTPVHSEDLLGLLLGRMLRRRLRRRLRRMLRFKLWESQITNGSSKWSETIFKLQFMFKFTCYNGGPRSTTRRPWDSNGAPVLSTSSRSLGSFPYALSALDSLGLQSLQSIAGISHC